MSKKVGKYDTWRNKVNDYLEYIKAMYPEDFIVVLGDSFKLSFHTKNINKALKRRFKDIFSMDVKTTRRSKEEFVIRV